MFKPVFNGSCISVSCVLPGAFVPDAAGGSGEIVCARFYDHAVSGGCDYVREEKHTMLPDGCLIENRVWQGRVPKDLPSALPTSSVPAWSGIAPSVFIKGLKTPLFSYFCMPGGVADDPYSPLGASVFSKVVPLINEADRQFSRLVWEFEGGELAVDASDDVFLPGRDGKPVLPEGKERLFRPNALDSLSSSALPLSTFSPALRDVSIINGLNRIIMFIEDGVGLARGTLSDPNVSALTATEIRTSRQRTYVTVRDIQQSLGSALRGLCDACSALCDLYSIGPSGVCLPTFSFGDSVLADSLTERSADLEEVSAGVRTRDEYRSKWRISPNGT